MVNKSSHILTETERVALNKGISFCPTTKVDWFGLEMNLHALFRNIKLKVMFGDIFFDVSQKNISEITLRDVGLCKKSNFTPVINSSAIDTFIAAVKNGVCDLRERINPCIPRSNMSKAEKAAIRGLAQNDTFIIKPADKGGALVVMDTSLYLQEIMRQLDDRSVYEPLPGNPKFRLSRLIEQFTEEALMAGIIDKSLKEYLNVDHPTTPVIYCLPKIHKSLVSPPGRPIVAGSGSIFNPLAIFFNKILRRHVITTKSYIKDTPDFLRKIHDISDVEHNILVSFDVANLYTSINHQRGIEKITNILIQTKCTNECVTFLLGHLEIVLTENYSCLKKHFINNYEGPRWDLIWRLRTPISSWRPSRRR